MDEFEQVVEEYLSDPLKGSGDIAERDALHNYLDRFTDLYRRIRVPARTVYGWRTQHDDKSATAIKARIARKLLEKEKMSWTRAYEYAASTEEYSEFLQERAFHYESWDSVSHLRDTIKQYIINIGQRLSDK